VHAAVAVALYFTIVRLLRSTALGREPRFAKATPASAAIAAALFSLHPLRVEAVAWVPGLHHALGALFFLVSIYAYLRSRGAPETRRRWMTASLLGYALSMLSGPIGVTLPVVLLILDAYLSNDSAGGLRRFHPRASLREKAPFFAVALFASLTLLGRSATYHLTTLAHRGVIARLSQMQHGMAFYLWKTLAPWGLSPLYPLPKHIDSLSWPFLLSDAMVAAITLAALALRRRRPSVLAAWSYYFVVLLPVSGLVHSGYQIAADRYTYAASFGFAALVAGALMRFWGENGRRVRRGSALATGAVLVVLSFLTRRQIRVWHDPESLWKHSLALDPDNAVAQFNLVSVLVRDGKDDEALPHYRSAVEAYPSMINGSIDDQLLRNGNPGEVLDLFMLMVRQYPYFAEAHYGLGEALIKNGKDDEGLLQLESAVQLSPEFPEAHDALGLAYYKRGELPRAARHFRMAIHARPDFAQAHSNLGGTLARLGKIDEAIGEFALALGAQPDNVDAHNNLAALLAGQGKIDEAVAHFRSALRLDPQNAAARDNLALLLKRAGREK
jgi:Flp pilus assembly protein TadD